MVKRLDDSDNIKRVNTSGAAVGEDGDQHVLFEAEGAGIQGEGPRRHRNRDGLRRQHSSHESSYGERHNLCGNRANANLVLPVTEKLVGE